MFTVIFTLRAQPDSPKPPSFETKGCWEPTFSLDILSIKADAARSSMFHSRFTIQTLCCWALGLRSLPEPPLGFAKNSLPPGFGLTSKNLTLRALSISESSADTSQYTALSSRKSTSDLRLRWVTVCAPISGRTSKIGFQIPTIREFYGSTEGNAAAINFSGKLSGMIGHLAPSMVVVQCDPATGAIHRDVNGFAKSVKPEKPGCSWVKYLN